jgi:hypothetical protein
MLFNEYSGAWIQIYSIYVNVNYVIHGISSRIYYVHLLCLFILLFLRMHKLFDYFKCLFFFSSFELIIE